MLRPELAAVIGGERFLSEITTTAELQHPHILALFDSGEADGFLCYVMPFVEGETLRDRLDREKQLGVDEAVRIAHDVADALDYAHRNGVIHRDIKPANILRHDGRPVVAGGGRRGGDRDPGGHHQRPQSREGRGELTDGRRCLPAGRGHREDPAPRPARGWRFAASRALPAAPPDGVTRRHLQLGAGLGVLRA